MVLRVHPKYSMALWMGSDVNIALANYSSAAAAFWSKIMTSVCSGLPEEKFSEMPYTVVKVDGEYYTEGTQPKKDPDVSGTSSYDGQEPSSSDAGGTSNTEPSVDNYYDTPVYPEDF